LSKYGLLQRINENFRFPLRVAGVEVGLLAGRISSAEEPLNNYTRARRAVAGDSGTAWASAVSYLVRFAASKKRQIKKRLARAVWLFQVSELKRGGGHARARSVGVSPEKSHLVRIVMTIATRP